MISAARPPERSTACCSYLLLPSRANEIPAVVMLHGSAGMIYDRAKYGPQLASMGIAVLLVETYDSRRDLATSFIARVLNITETMFVADAYAALHYLANRPEVDGHRVALAGFSYGGMATEYALYAQMADALSPDGPRFVGHVAFYAPCIARFADSRTTGAPLLMLYGAGDELIRPARCEQVADDLRSGGSQVEIISYPGRCSPMGRRHATRTDRPAARGVSLYGFAQRHGARPEHRTADVRTVPAQDYSGSLHRQPTLSDRPRRRGASQIESRFRRLPGARLRRIAPGYSRTPARVRHCSGPTASRTTRSAPSTNISRCGSASSTSDLHSNRSCGFCAGGTARHRTRREPLVRSRSREKLGPIHDKRIALG